MGSCPIRRTKCLCAPSRAVMTASRWYKCDLQVATPAWKFSLPAGSSYDFSLEEDRASFADAYMERLRECGIEVIALADHNTGAWLPVMQAAGHRYGIVVFPGVEVTTASGSDGAHLVLIGDLDRTEQDINVLLASTCGFDDDHPRFNPQTHDPAPAPRTVNQILDALPDQWLAFAPHVLTDNGLASGKTVRGDLRWKALHHDRLGAVDPGEVTEERRAEKGFVARFLNRALNEFPCLARIPFLATSDAYSLESLGSRFTWIRMDTPSKESLRQAFLDHDARIMPSWDPRLTANPDPNVVDHAWVGSIELGGTLGNSVEPLRVSFDPRLNVIIGGRGAGKSTVVSALRQLYGSTQSLPDSIEHEATAFVDGVFSEARLTAQHRLAISREQQTALWSSPLGSRTERNGVHLPTHFPMRVFSQKELFERTAHDRADRFAASKHLLSLVDEALEADAATPGGFAIELDAVRTQCLTRVAKRLSVEARLAQRPSQEARHGELLHQIEAFGDAESQSSRLESERIRRDHARLGADAARFEAAVDELGAATIQRLEAALPKPPTGLDEEPRQLYAELAQIRAELNRTVRASVIAAKEALEQNRQRQQTGVWADRVQRADMEIIEFQQRLSLLGVEPTAYLSLTEALNSVQGILRELEDDEAAAPGLRSAEEAAWSDLERTYERRRRRRERLFAEVAKRSGSLRFEVVPHGNCTSWVQDIRGQLGVRSGGFVDDIPALAEWLWNAPLNDGQRRQELWRRSLLTRDFTQLRQEAGGKATWWSKLAKLESTQRIRLAMNFPDDAVVMYFLRDGGKAENDADWQSVTTGSPGQRSAAMLSFVLHHGTEPLVLDQPEDDLDTAWISQLIVPEIRKSRWHRQVIVITHNANIPVNADAERVIVLENDGSRIRIKTSASKAGTEGHQEQEHVGPIEVTKVRHDIQDILEGGTAAFMSRERRYNNELSTYRAALHG
ncbi:TrlF family AAA-like ATPase [Streptomyces afghaniensis]|uniref:TrlF family AAA-like ATPase n=1 Tax=Streptomyces afghaniensis TaxID=66865 RepID=UPI0037A3DD93